jgi:hypothetical protein
LKQIDAGLAGEGSEPAATARVLVCFAAGKPDPYLEKAFDQLALTDTSMFPPALELLLVPGLLVTALVHAPIGGSSGLAVPVGFISFDHGVIERAQAYIAERVGAFRLQEALYESIMADLSGDSAGEVGRLATK